MLDLFKVRVNDFDHFSMTLNHRKDSEYPLFEIIEEYPFEKSNRIISFDNFDKSSLYFTDKINSIHLEYLEKYKSSQTAFFRGVNLHPWDKNFFSNIEPKVKPLIRVLVDKLYLTTSSCQSHQFDSSAYIDIAFTNEKSKQTFISHLTNLTGKMYLFNIQEMYLGAYMDRNFGGYEKSKSINDLDYWCSEEESIKMLNYQFNLNFSKWYIVRILIKRNSKFKLERIFVKIFYKFFLTSRFNKLEKIFKKLPVNNF